MKISIKQYAQTLFELTDGKSEQEISDVVKSFSGQLKKDGQMKNAGKIMEKFSQLYNQAHGIVEAMVITKEALRKDAEGRIENLIKEKYSAKEVIIENKIDEKIRGGIIIRIGNDVMDGSVETQLKKLKNILSK